MERVKVFYTFAVHCYGVHLRKKTKLYHYEVHLKKEKSLTPEMVSENIREKYEKPGWDKIAKLHTTPDISYLYLVPKLKDINKMKPLASQFKQMLKFVYRYASMALLVVLKNLSNTHNFNIFQTFDTMEKF